MKIDLHAHSNHSDGTWSVEDLIEYAVESGITHLALTDHDTVSGITPARAAVRNRLSLIAGVEINTIHPDRDGKLQDVHILGYFIDPDNDVLKEVLQDQQRLRQEHVALVIKRLNDAGVALTLADIEKFSGAGSIGKAHITKALVAIGAATDIMDAYENYTSKKSAFYVQRQSVSPSRAIHGIRAAGGIASLAHSGKRDDVVSLLRALMEEGLEAVEVFHRMHAPAQQEYLIEFATVHDLLITGGSDCHGPYEEFAPTLGTITCPQQAFEILLRRHVQS